MINIAIFASGEGTNAEKLIQHFAGSTKVRINWIVTNKDDAGVVAKATKYRKGVQILSRYVLENYTEKFIEFLKLEKIDLIVLAGFLLKMPEKIVAAYPYRIINLHPALLPKFGGKGMYGMHVHKAVIDAKEKESGISIHFVNEEYDKGEMILQEKCVVDENETPETLAAKIHELEHKFFPLAVERVVENLEVVK
ncbi:MAG: phosphoribosylglycinamide formyltransferase [Bacteroidia bacterium]|nr:phosphoribosylglycinamide formyltransferase [Bacteroidia bacterium]